MHLTIGVTGHRDLLAEEIPALKKKVREFFLQLRSSFPNLALQLINPLAEGSDRLVADVAQELGIELVVPLPMPQEDYEKDFISAEAVDAFRESIKNARVINLRTLPESAGLMVTPEDRGRQYAQLGIFISNHSQVLLAIWDGKPSTAPGGTASVVNYHLTAVMPGYAVAEESPNLLADNENDLAYHITCSRDRPDGQPKEGLMPLQTAWITAHYGLETGEEMPLEYRIMLNRLEDFGRDQAKYQDGIDKDGVDLLEGAPDLEYPAGTQIIAERHRVADWLAIHFQKRISFGLIAIHVLAVVIGLVFIIYSEFDGLDFLVNFFLFAFLAGFVVFKIGEQRQWHRKHLDYRALAEGLRVQFYWSLAGVIDVRSAEFAYDNFLQKQDVDLGWIRHVMRNVSLARSRDRLPSPLWVEWVIEQWVGNEEDQSGQFSYYKRKQLEKAKRFKRTTNLGRIALWTGIFIAVWLAIAGQDMTDFQRHLLLVLMGIFPLIAGIRDAYSHKKAEKELIKQYRFMSGILANARRLLDSTDDIHFRRRVLRALGNAALEEDAEWILMHRERPLEHSGI
ncbi:MAG: hypothetical protein GQ538_10595 [Xanthomonadales bacterium]|nr:hypothetical protein [Xanthomonadales bacterium]